SPGGPGEGERGWRASDAIALEVTAPCLSPHWRGRRRWLSVIMSTVQLRRKAKALIDAMSGPLARGLGVPRPRQVPPRRRAHSGAAHDPGLRPPAPDRLHTLRVGDTTSDETGSGAEY